MVYFEWRTKLKLIAGRKTARERVAKKDERKASFLCGNVVTTTIQKVLC
jgi:hypothetical protein